MLYAPTKQERGFSNPHADRNVRAPVDEIEVVRYDIPICRQLFQFFSKTLIVNHLYDARIDHR